MYIHTYIHISSVIALISACIPIPVLENILCLTWYTKLRFLTMNSSHKKKVTIIFPTK